MMPTPVVEVEGLCKRFGRMDVVNDLSFAVRPGEVYGFLGQNGAGKSTTIRMLLTLIRPTAGRIRLFGQEVEEHRRSVLARTGALIEKPDLYTYLSALDNLRIFARLSGIKADKKVLMRQLEIVGIAARAESKVRTFSQGMKQRLGIACALVHGPQLIVLDEPTNGLDPQGIADIRRLIQRLSREEGRTVLVSSHLLYEVEQMADSMLIIDRGRKVAEGRVRELLDPADTLVEVQTGSDEQARALLQESAWAPRLQAGPRLQLRMHRDAVPDLVRFLTDRQLPIRAVQPRHSLEDFFLTLTNAQPHVAPDPDRAV